MTREQWKEKLPLMQAFVDGKDIEVLNYHDGKWKVNDNIQFTSFIDGYRVKAEPKYRPFRNAEECWEEMKKHELFGWIQNKNSLSIMCISMVDPIHVRLGLNYQCTYQGAFDSYTFVDGKPFGVKED